MTNDKLQISKEKVYVYNIIDFIAELIIFGGVPIAGLYLTYFAISRDLDKLLIAIAIGFNIMLFIPELFILLKARHKIIITETGIAQQKLCKLIHVAWSDIESIEYDTIVSSFSQSRFTKPKDIIIKSKHGDVVCVMESLIGFSEVKQLITDKAGKYRTTLS